MDEWMSRCTVQYEYCRLVGGGGGGGGVDTRPRVIDLIRFLFFPSLLPRLLGGDVRKNLAWLVGWLVGWWLVRTLTGLS